MHKKKNRHLIFVELNEFNFDLAVDYVRRDNLTHIGRMLNEGICRSDSEASYEKLEPWIQWVSAHTGKSADEHGIFRLGDIVGSKIPQYFERVEEAGYSVGCISAMNAENRLRRPAYFIPDPWTMSATDGSFWGEKLSAAISQAVNDNAQSRLTRKSLLTLLGGLAVFARPCNYLNYIKLALQSRAGGWRKALFLDLFLHDLHIRLFKKKRPNFSTVFFNAGAHIQHHYLLNAKESVISNVENPVWYVGARDDPFREMLKVYDRILGDYLEMDGVDLVVATGLTQKPYDRIKYYWRLKSHAAFLMQLGVRYKNVYPRMTRDFLIEFASNEDASEAALRLAKVVTCNDSVRVFEEVDQRDASLFVTLTYSGPINGSLLVNCGGFQIDIAEHVVFVAIKNGMHDPKGFVYYKGNIKNCAVPSGSHVKEMYKVVARYFEFDETSERGERALASSNLLPSRESSEFLVEQI